MFYQNRFTERARQALTLAQEAAASFGHSYIGSEHLLLGLLREGGGPAAKALAAAGVTDEALVKQIEELSGRGTPDAAAPQGMTPRTKRIVELSVQSANEMGTGYVGTEHLLLGILREGQNVALTALANLKITPEILVRKLNEALGGAQDGVSAETGASAGGADSKDALAQFGRDLTAAAKEGFVESQVRRRVARRLPFALNDVSARIDHDHVFRCHAVIRHAGGLDNHQATLAVDPGDIAPSERDQTVFWKQQICLQNVLFQLFQHSARLTSASTRGH